MTTAAEFRPTAFNSSIASASCGRLPGDWLVVPVSITRDTQDPVTLSNFRTALRLLGGESETVRVDRFNHWGPGWFEVITVDPSDVVRVSVLRDIERSLEAYPILDEQDWSDADLESRNEAYDNHYREMAYKRIADLTGVPDIELDAIRINDDKVRRAVTEDMEVDGDSGMCVYIDRCITDWRPFVDSHCVATLETLFEASASCEFQPDEHVTYLDGSQTACAVWHDGKRYEIDLRGVPEVHHAVFVRGFLTGVCNA